MKYLMALVILLSINFTTSTAFAAPRNGDGLVYHRSDCGDKNVRMYGEGGDSIVGGSMCGEWLFSKFLVQLVHSTDYNFNTDQLNCMQRQFTTQKWDTFYTISDAELNGCDLLFLLNSEGFRELSKKKVQNSYLYDPACQSVSCWGN